MLTLSMGPLLFSDTAFWVIDSVRCKPMWILIRRQSTSCTKGQV